MKKFSLAVATLALMSGSAVAADLSYAVKAPVASAVPFTWTGFYFGVNAGYGGNNDSQTIAGTDKLTNTIIGTGLIPGMLATKSQGWVAGGQIGYNYQMGLFVVGVETDLQGAGISGSAAQLLTTAPFGGRAIASLSTTGSSALDWYGTFRGRIGVTPVDRLLVYATGGAAYGRVVDNTSTSLAVLVGGVPVPGLNVAAVDANAATRFGWTIGAGFEYAMTQHWFLKTEYQYLNFGSHTDAFGTTLFRTPLNFTVAQTNDYHIAKVGVNYRW